MKFWLGFSCAGLLWLSDAAAQMELRGRLVNATTNAAVYPGTVLVLGTALSAQTNEKGDFAISSGSLPSGGALTIMASGYQFESKVLSYPLAGSTFKADFKIELEIPIRLDRYVRQTASEERPAFSASGRIVDEQAKGLPGVHLPMPTGISICASIRFARSIKPNSGFRSQGTSPHVRCFPSFARIDSGLH